MHASGMVAASYFARAAAWLTPLTLSFRTLSATPLESPDPERARTYLIVREALLQCSPFCTCLPLTRTLSVLFRTFTLHAYPSKHAFTFASAHVPESLHNCARSSREAHLASSSLHYTQTDMFPAPSAPPSAPPRTMFSARVRSRQPVQNRKCYRRASMESKIGADRNSNSN